MKRYGTHDSWPVERRRSRRLKISVPVRFGKDTEGGAEALFPRTARTAELSPGGAYLRSREVGELAPGDIMRVAIEIPRQTRKLFPFSRITGQCRLVRVDKKPATRRGLRTGLALAFCEEGIILLSSMGLEDEAQITG